jgi:acetyltransferase-like isoleucine patch superfamily enzyme
MLRLKRGDGPFFRTALKIIKTLMRANFPVPPILKPVFRGVYQFHYTAKHGIYWVYNYFYCSPIFRARCAVVGKNLHLWLLPDVSSHTRIEIGDNVNIFGHLGVGSGRVFDQPTLKIGNNVDLGHNVFFTVNKRVDIEDNVNIASNVYILDSDAHPRDPYERAKKVPPSPDEIKPIRICRYAWIGQGSYIMKGVTIGEGAIIGANSVVLSDIPPFSVALGNPARVILKDTRAKLETAPVPVSAT